MVSTRVMSRFDLRPPFGTRRGALGALLGGAIGLLGETGTASKKRRKRRRRCSCPGDRLRLANGTCAAACETTEDCLGGCECKTSLEFGKHCGVDVPSCDPIPLECDSTAECPLGMHCQGTGCGTNRCVALCA
jgi:hypothetical protein